RTGDGDQQFLFWFLGNAFKTGGTADRQQRNVRRADAEMASHEGVPQFVEQNAKRKKHDEKGSLGRGVGASLAIVAECDPRQEDKEREVNFEINAPNTGNSDGPAHRLVKWLNELHAPPPLPPLRSLCSVGGLALSSSPDGSGTGIGEGVRLSHH